MRKHVLALGEDPAIQQTLWQAFGNEVEVMYNDGHQPILNLVGDIPPDVILADIKLFRESNLSDQIKGDERVVDVPLLLLADEGEMIPDDQLAHWGAAGIINQPVDAEELKLRVGNFLDTYTTIDGSQEISIDEFRLDNLDEELRNLSQRQESPIPSDKEERISPNNDQYTNELDQILAEIDEIPTTEQKEGAEMKAEERPVEQEEGMVIQESNATTPKIEMEVTPSPQGSANLSSSSTNGAIEQWLRSIAEDKVAQVIAHEDFGEIIEKIAQSVVPQVAEKLVSTEIERIKKKIAGE